MTKEQIMAPISRNERLTVMEIYQYLLERGRELREGGDNDLGTEMYYIAGLLERTEEINLTKN